VAIILIGEPSESFQDIEGIVSRNGGKKMMNMARLDETPDQSIEREMVILETICDALAWRRIPELAEEKSVSPRTVIYPT
jgi:hypothetical protein